VIGSKVILQQFISLDQQINLRPISVVPIIAKILEKLVAFQLSAYLQSQLLSPYQGAYCNGRSTEQIAVDTITQALDAYQVVCITFLDLRKVFDSLDHVIL